MKVIAINSDKSLSIKEVPIPQVDKDTVLIRTCYAALNRADLLQREGSYPPPPGWPEWMGLEVSGIVEQIGENVMEIKVGDKVCALLGGGGYAEYVLVPKELVVKAENLDLKTACCLPEVYSTAYLNLFIEGNLKSNETVLVFAGASGVGIAVTQIAKLFGAKVIATVRSDEKVKEIEKFGADIIVNTSKIQPYEIFDKYPVDLVIDCVGGENAGKCIARMNRGGRWICIATLGGDMVGVDFRELYKRGVRIIGSTLRSRNNETKENILKKLQTEIMPAVVNGKITPAIHKVFDFYDVESAHDEMYKNKNIGKILLKIGLED